MTSQPNPTEQNLENEATESFQDESPQTDLQPEGGEGQLDESSTVESQEEELSEVELLKQQLSEASDRWLRSQAELENVRRRARRDVEEQLKFAIKPFATDLLEIVENLDRAMEAGGSGEAADGQMEGLMSGVKMVALQFSEVLKKHGCLRIDSTGQVFDPNIHEAVQMVPNEAANGTIVQELRSGYKLHDRVIRPAQVIISSGPAS